MSPTTTRCTLLLLLIVLLVNCVTVATKKAKKRKGAGAAAKPTDKKKKKNEKARPTNRCLACEQLGRSMHSDLSKGKLKGASVSVWASHVQMKCTHEGCADLLTKSNLNLLAAELKDMHDDAVDSKAEFMETAFLQAFMCFELTEACPTGIRGTTLHKFQAVGEAQDEVSVTFYSRLPTGNNVEIYWVDPQQDETPGGFIGELKPGGSLAQTSYSNHQFKFIRPREKYTAKHGVSVTIVIGPEPTQRFEIHLNKSFVEDIPLKIPDPHAVAPEEWDEEEDGAWKPPMVTNPARRGNNLYIVKKLHEEEGSSVERSGAAKISLSPAPGDRKEKEEGGSAAGAGGSGGGSGGEGGSPGGNDEEPEALLEHSEL